MKDILQMGEKEILTLAVEDVTRLLTSNEITRIATILGAFWAYDYNAAEQGRVGMHAILKSGLHSDGFFISRILLEPKNIKNIISRQIVMRLQNANISVPDYVAGVPDGATALGLNVAEIMGTRKAHMEKVDGRITLRTEIPAEATVLIVEDFCTRGKGFTEAVLEIKKKQPFVAILPYDPVIINRGGLKEIFIGGVGIFTILSVTDLKIQDWDPNYYCPLCAFGSVAIKPKLTDKNWRSLMMSQL